MSVSDDDALLRAVLAAPDDDAPRLVYADWLDEQGDAPRARFIRTQVELARMRPEHPRHESLTRTERALWRQHGDAWSAWLPAWVGERKFVRGFLEWVRCDAVAFVAGADELRRRTPLAGVRLEGTQGEVVVPLFRSRVLEGMRSLTLRVPIPLGAWEHFAACPYLGRLRELSLNSQTPADELVTRLMTPQLLPALRRLRITWSTLADEQTARLVRNPWVTRLRMLDLRSNFIEAEGGLALARTPHLDRLNVLDLRDNPVAGHGLAAETLRQRFGERVRL